MEDVFDKVSEVTDDFLESIDGEQLKKGTVGRDHDDSDAIDPQALTTILACKSDKSRLSAEAECFSLHGRSPGHAMRWFTGCDCHDYICSQKISEKAKKGELRPEEQPLPVSLFSVKLGIQKPI